MQVRKGDLVEVVAGRDKGKRGKILFVDPRKDRVIVEGVQIVKRHSRPGKQNPQGGIIEREAPLAASNVMVVDPKSDKPTRIGHKRIEGDKKIRIARRSGEALP